MARKAVKNKKRATRGASVGTSPSKTADADRRRLEGSYERLRRALERGPDDGRIDRPLSYWVLPTDRRLPMAFLDRSIRDLIAEPLEDLMRTPGVGRIKILGLFELLRRVVKAESPDAPFGMTQDAAPSEPTERVGQGIEPSEVSEAVWSRWCEVVLRSGFGGHRLGRVAPSLRTLPTVIWETSLEEYAGRTLAEIRSLKTHGEKRVNAVLEVFGSVYEAISAAALHEELQLELTPRFVPELTRWLAERRSPVGRQEVCDRVAAPLIAQIECDLGPEVARLSRERLALTGSAPTVISQAKRLKVTRTRVYQLLEDCGRVMAVRWPEGRWLLGALTQPEGAEAEVVDLAERVAALFFPAPAER